MAKLVEARGGDAGVREVDAKPREGNILAIGAVFGERRRPFKRLARSGPVATFLKELRDAEKPSVRRIVAASGVERVARKDGERVHTLRVTGNVAHPDSTRHVCSCPFARPGHQLVVATRGRHG